jgi:hypothetical protein
MPNRLTRFAVPAGRATVLALFWLYVLAAVLSIPFFVWILVFSPQGRIIWPPRGELVIHGLLLVGTAAFGWFHRFKKRFAWFWLYMAALGTFYCAVGILAAGR